MGAGDFNLDKDGNRVFPDAFFRLSNGVDDTCCCGEATDPVCQACSKGYFPSEVTVVIAGLTLNTACTSFGKWSGSVANGTYDLPFINPGFPSITCLYKLQGLPAGLTLTQFSGAGCTGTPSTITDFTLRVEFNFTGNHPGSMACTLFVESATLGSSSIFTGATGSLRKTSERCSVLVGVQFGMGGSTVGGPFLSSSASATIFPA